MIYKNSDFPGREASKFSNAAKDSDGWGIFRSIDKAKRTSETVSSKSSCDLGDLEREIEAVRSDISKCSSDRADLEKTVHTLEGKLSSSRVNVVELEKKLEQARAQVSELQREHALISRRLAAKEGEISQFNITAIQAENALRVSHAATNSLLLEFLSILSEIKVCSLQSHALLHAILLKILINTIILALCPQPQQHIPEDDASQARIAALKAKLKSAVNTPDSSTAAKHERDRTASQSRRHESTTEPSRRSGDRSENEDAGKVPKGPGGQDTRSTPKTTEGSKSKQGADSKATPKTASKGVKTPPRQGGGRTSFRAKFRLVVPSPALRWQWSGCRRGPNRALN